MENISMSQVRDTIIVVLAVMAFFVLLGNTVKTYKSWKKPQTDFYIWQRKVDDKLSNDNERLKSMEAGNKVICRGILALLSHEINGNSNDKLKESQREITDYLIER